MRDEINEYLLRDKLTQLNIYKDRIEFTLEVAWSRKKKKKLICKTRSTSKLLVSLVSNFTLKILVVIVKVY